MFGSFFNPLNSNSHNSRQRSGGRGVIENGHKNSDKYSDKTDIESHCSSDDAVIVRGRSSSSAHAPASLAEGQGEEGGFDIVIKTLDVPPLRQLLDSLNLAIIPNSFRLRYLQQAYRMFDHRDKKRHDEELSEGAAYVLYQKLAFVLTVSNDSGYRNKSNADIPSDYALAAYDDDDDDEVDDDPYDVDHEISLTCSCLEMVHRATPTAIAQTWKNIGKDILPLLVQVMERPFKKFNEKQQQQHNTCSNTTDYNDRRRMQQPSHSNHYDDNNSVASSITNKSTGTTTESKLSIQKISKLISAYSAIPEAKIHIANCPGMLSVLVKIIDTRQQQHKNHYNTVIRNNNTTTTTNVKIIDNHNQLLNSVISSHNGGIHRSGSMNSAYRLVTMTEAIRFTTIAALLNLSSEIKNTTSMLEEPNLLVNITRIIHTNRISTATIARNCSLLTLMSLFGASKTEYAPLQEEEVLLETIIELVKDEHDVYTPQIRYNAAVALCSIKNCQNQDLYIRTFADGVVLDTIIEILSLSIEYIYDGSSSNCINAVDAAETLYLMACSDATEMNELLSNHTGLLELLVSIVSTTIVSPPTDQRQSLHHNIQVLCVQTIRRLAGIIKKPMKSQKEFLSTLVQTSFWDQTSDIAEAFERHARCPENRLPMAEYYAILNALGKYALINKKRKSSNDESNDNNEERGASTTTEGEEEENNNNNHNKINKECYDKIQSAALSAIEYLAYDEAARPSLAQHDDIMSALKSSSSSSRRNNNRLSNSSHRNRMIPNYSRRRNRSLPTNFDNL